MSSSKRGGRKLNPSATAAAENDPFFRSLSALKEILLRQQREQQPPNTKQRHALKEKEQREGPHQEQDCDSLKELESQLSTQKKKLEEALAATEKERTLRGTLDRAFKELETHRKELTAQLEVSDDARKGDRDQIRSLRQRLEVSEKKEQEWVDERHTLVRAKDDSSNKQDALESRMLTAEKLNKELTEKLAASDKRLLEEKNRQEESAQSLLNVNKRLEESLKLSKKRQEELSVELSKERKELTETQALLRDVTEHQSSSSGLQFGGGGVGDAGSGDDATTEEEVQMQARLKSLETETNQIRRGLDRAFKTTDESKAMLDSLKEVFDTKPPAVVVDPASLKKPPPPSATVPVPSGGETEGEEDVQSQLRAKNVMLDQRQQRITELEKKLSTVTKQLEEVTQQRDEVESESESDLKRLMDELEESAKESNELRQELDKSVGRAEDLDQQLLEQTQDILANKVALSSALEEIEHLKRELSRKREREEEEQADAPQDDDDEVEVLETQSPAEDSGADEEEPAVEAEVATEASGVQRHRKKRQRAMKTAGRGGK